MQDTPNEVAAAAEWLKTSWLNGNLSYVRDKLRKLPSREAVAVAATLAASFNTPEGRRLIRLLTTDLEDDPSRALSDLADLHREDANP